MLVSAGFDAHRLDPLADCRVSEAGYAAMTASLRRACEAVGAPMGLVLEGGYSLEALCGSWPRWRRCWRRAAPGARTRSRSPAGDAGRRAAGALVARAPSGRYFGTTWRA